MSVSGGGQVARQEVNTMEGGARVKMASEGGKEWRKG